MKKLLVGMMAAFLAGAAFQLEAGEMGSGDFLRRVRHPAAGETWGRFRGEVKHRRQGGETEKASIYFGVSLQKTRMIGQIVIGDNEGYYIGQTFGKDSGTVSPMKQGGYGKDSLMARYGLAPSDLTMSFVHYKLLKEFPGEVYRMLNCRIFDLETPAELGGGKVKIWVSKNYYSPLKAEFYRPLEEKPFRTLEVDSFREKNNLYYAETINVYGSGWRTQVVFNQAELGLWDGKSPQDIYEKIPGSGQ